MTRNGTRSIGDIDIDFSDRSSALSCLAHIPASIIKKNKIDRHNTGVYFHSVPTDPVTGISSLDYEEAESRGWYKIDLLNVGIYEQIRDEKHLLHLMEKPFDWRMLEYPEFVGQLIHLGNHGQLVSDLKPSSIEDLSMVLALIRPGKRHLIDTCKKNGFSSIKHEIWEDPKDGSYFFKKAHAVSYATLVKVHANLIIETAEA